ncbi:hypothetical protein NFI96_023568, partial [Prochilodus magdalenae]
TRTGRESGPCSPPSFTQRKTKEVGITLAYTPFPSSLLAMRRLGSTLCLLLPHHGHKPKSNEETSGRDRRNFPNEDPWGELYRDEVCSRVPEGLPSYTYCGDSMSVFVMRP